VSDHPSAASDPDPDSETPPETGRDVPPAAATDTDELDFSRLRLARASLDGAFPER
jgi:hypothetical protein